MIIELQSRMVSVDRDQPSAVFAPDQVMIVELAGNVANVPCCRAVVELRQFQGGMAPHVLVGGKYEPGGERLIVKVGTMAVLARRRTCAARFGRRLIPGLLEEYGESVLGGLARTLQLGPGVVTIDRFGFDPVETSELATELASEILGRVLNVAGEPSDSDVRAWLEALP